MAFPLAKRLESIDEMFVNKTDSRKVHQHVLRVMREVGAEQLRTDELSVMRGLFQKKNTRFAWLTGVRANAGELMIFIAG